jgi:hypothetical protein
LFFTLMPLLSLLLFLLSIFCLANSCFSSFTAEQHLERPLMHQFSPPCITLQRPLFPQMPLLNALHLNPCACDAQETIQCKHAPCAIHMLKYYAPALC